MPKQTIFEGELCQSGVLVQLRKFQFIETYV